MDYHVTEAEGAETEGWGGSGGVVGGGVFFWGGVMYEDRVRQTTVPLVPVQQNLWLVQPSPTVQRYAYLWPRLS